MLLKQSGRKAGGRACGPEVTSLCQAIWVLTESSPGHNPREDFKYSICSRMFSFCGWLHPLSPHFVVTIAMPPSYVQRVTQQCSGLYLPWGHLRELPRHPTVGKPGGTREVALPGAKLMGAHTRYMLFSSVPWSGPCEGILHIFSESLKGSKPLAHRSNASPPIPSLSLPSFLSPNKLCL